MMKKRKASLATIIFAFVIAVILGVYFRQDSDILQEQQRISSETITFRKEGNLTSHYEKHGVEMGFSSEEEYLEAANAVINHPDSLHKLEAEDGDDVYYLEATNEFVVVSQDGYIRTYFCPEDGIDYYNRQ